MAAGTVEAIPLVQTALYGIRMLNQHGGSDFRARLYTGHENKFMPYRSLVERDWRIGGADDDEIERVTEIFKQKIQQNGGAQNIPMKRQMELAEEAIRG